MIIFPDYASIEQLPHPELRQVIQQSIQQITQGEAYDPDVYGKFVLIEVGDVVAEVEAATGCQILHCDFNSTQFGDPAFAPSFEWLVEHAICYEAVFILSDDGFGIDLLIPKAQGVDPTLLAMCEQYAVPA